MGEKRCRLTNFREVRQVSISDAHGHVKRQLVVVPCVVQLFHELDHGLPRLDWEAKLTALILEIIADGTLLLEHVQVDLLRVLWCELPWHRLAAQLENVGLVAVGDPLADFVLPTPLHNLVWWQRARRLLILSSSQLSYGRGRTALRV